MNLPPFYTAFCMAVLGAFVYAKVEGLSLFGAGAAAANPGGVSRSSGAFIGAHK